MGIFDGFLDNLASGLLGPKGNLADWQHASRLYVTNNQRHAPKYKFLYHVTFTLTDAGKSKIPEVADYLHEIGMLVKSCDLPKYRANVETKNKYNRKKHHITKLEYEPINISFYDDNFGATTALLEAYYKYYFADGNYGEGSAAYGNKRTGDTTYDGPGTNSFKFGLDNNLPSVPFFDKIEISQMAKRSYTKFTLVNPIISSFSHDSVDNSDNSGLMTNNITVEYDSVIYDRGVVEGGDNGNPTGFGRTSHYDVTPSPLSIQGGASLGIDGTIGAAVDLYDYITKGKNFSNPFAAGIAAANLFSNVRNLSSDGLRAGGLNILTDVIGGAAGIDVSGVSKTSFPKSNGSGGIADVVVATAAVAGLTAIAGRTSGISTSTGDSNPQSQDDARFQNFKKSYLNSSGTGGINGARAAFDALPSSQKSNYD